MSEMHPSEQYFKAKRNLALFAALLLISDFALKGNLEVFGGLFISNEQISPILYALVFYSYVQFVFAWYWQGDKVKSYNSSIVDYLFLNFIAVGASIYFIKFNYPFSLPSNLILIGITLLIIFTIIQKLKQKTNKQINDILINGNWELVFNVHSQGNKGKKKIKFEPDGSIFSPDDTEHGRFNEAKWRLDKGFLEIFRKDDKLQSRFKYDEKRDIFNHTNEEDTLSKRDQIIRRI